MSVTVERRAALLIGDDALATLLIQRHLLPAIDVERCFQEAIESGMFLEEGLIRQGLLTDVEIRTALESHFFCASVDLSSPSVEPQTLRLLPATLARQHLALPLRLEGDELRVALARPDCSRVLQALARASGHPILPAVALRHELREAITTCYGAPGTQREGSASQRPTDTCRTGGTERSMRSGGPARQSVDVDPAQPVEVVNRLLRAAIERHATDVHFEPAEHFFGVRLRIDGILQRTAQLPRDLAASVTSRLKVLGGMDIAERRAPQDGRATFTLNDQSVDLRMSSLPSQHGEKVVVRLLRKDTSLLQLPNLNLPDEVAIQHQQMVDAPQGMFLVTGPTGSGKTTTLYATLNSLDRNSLSVVTLEDPIEYSLPGITQVQIHEAAGLSFSAGLHSILRQDPDVVLVGEIRDAETVEIACEAALTGHKVFSTLHTNDACQAVTRLLEMGVSPHLVAATVRGVLAQRLLRLNCPDCSVTRQAEETDRRLLNDETVSQVTQGEGCEACGRTGHRGRIAVFEYFRMDDELRRLVLESPSPVTLRQAARERGMTTMLSWGRRAVLDGRTSPAELQRVLLADDREGTPCPGCARPVGDDYTICPFCREVLHEVCGGCGRGIEPGWRACPACGTASEQSLGKTQCHRCAADLNPGWSTCPFCGNPSA